MAKATKTIVKDGLLYSVHSTAIENGKKKIADVHCPKPTAATLQDYIDKCVLTLEQVCDFGNHGMSIKLQADARRAATSEKITTAEYDAIYNELVTPEVQRQAFEDELPTKTYINEFIESIWQERKDALETV